MSTASKKRRGLYALLTMIVASWVMITAAGQASADTGLTASVVAASASADNTVTVTVRVGGPAGSAFTASLATGEAKDGTVNAQGWETATLITSGYTQSTIGWTVKSGGTVVNSGTVDISRDVPKVVATPGKPGCVKNGTFTVPFTADGATTVQFSGVASGTHDTINGTTTFTVNATGAGTVNYVVNGKGTKSFQVELCKEPTPEPTPTPAPVVSTVPGTTRTVIVNPSPVVRKVVAPATSSRTGVLDDGSWALVVLGLGLLLFVGVLKYRRPHTGRRH